MWGWGQLMLCTLTNWLFGCAHRRTGFPFTRRTQAGSETYVVCLECGKHFPYDWGAMQIATSKSPGAVGVLGTERLAPHG